MSTRPVMILAGGTGGHIFPGLAVAAALSQRQVPVVWLGSRRGMENQLVPAAGITLETLDIGGLRGKDALTRVLMPLRLLRAVWQAMTVLSRHRPRAVLSFGGYAAGPGGLAAWLRRLPLLVHEQNRAPGLTNRVLSRLARRVLVGFPDAFPGARWVGNPVRSDISGLPTPDQRLRDHNGPLRLLVLGGSQGARALNESVPDAVAQLQDALPQVLDVRHQCGRGNESSTAASYARHAISVTPEPFIEDMVTAYRWADLVVCRAGALTLAELAAAGLPSLLVPLPTAADDHQTRNAEFLVEHGAAELLPQGDALASRMAARIMLLANDRVRLQSMALAARALARLDAADCVADACIEVSAGVGE